MKLFHQLQGLRLTLLLTFMATCFLIATSTSCKKKSGSKSLADSESFTMHSLVLQKSSIQQWVDSGWTNPADTNRIHRLLLQFYSDDPRNIRENMQLITYPGKNFLNVHLGGKAFLDIDTASPLVLSGQTTFANNVINFDSLGIVNPDGSLTGFTRILFSPRLTGNHVTFTVHVYTNATTSTEKNGSNPCPPCQYCNPPNCPAYEL